MIRNEIKKLIQKALCDLQKSGALSSAELSEIKIDYPGDSSMGDYATNIAFILAKSEGQKPLLIAQVLAEKITAGKSAQKMFGKVQAAGAGFVNFTLSQEFLQKQLKDMVGPAFRKVSAGKGKKLNIEFLSANPTGKFQVGNGRGAFYGDVLGNIFKLAGYKVTKEYYVNNANSSNQIQELGKTALGQGDKYLTPYVEEKIESLRIPLPSPSQAEDEHKFAEAGFILAKAIQEDNQEFLERIGINFDVFTEEEKLYKRRILEKTFQFLKEKNFVYEEDGAQWLATTQFGDDKDKVVVRADGEYGYYLGDIAYHWDKIKRGYKVIVDIFGADHQGHVLPMKIAMKILGFKGKFDVLVTQLVQAKGGGKFSKRAGNIIELEELINEVGIDAARFFYLMKSVDTQMEFDMEIAKEQSEKNPVYYVQYAHARMASILRLAYRQAGKAQKKYQVSSMKYQVLIHSCELNVIKHLLRWSEVIEDTANDYQVQRVTAYAYGLATMFNQFYRDCRVISDDEKLTAARLELVVVSKQVLKEALGALGISAPEKM